MNRIYFQRTSTWLITFFFLVSGISIGAFTELSLPQDSKAQVGTYLMEHLFFNGASVDHGAVFLQSAANNAALLLLIFLSGLTAFGVPAAYAAVAYKGAALGFSAALLLESLRWQGAATLALTVVPPNLLILPALCLSVSAAVNTALETGGPISGRRGPQASGRPASRGSSRRKKGLSQEAGPYCSCFVLPLAMVTIAAVLEAFICPALLQLIK